jgi:hypothetical protein
MDKETAKKVFKIQRELMSEESELDYAIEIREKNISGVAHIEIGGVGCNLYISPVGTSLCEIILDEYIKSLKLRIKELQDALDAIYYNTNNNI